MAQQIRTAHFSGQLVSNGNRQALQGQFKIFLDHVLNDQPSAKLEAQLQPKLEELLMSEFDLTKTAASDVSDKLLNRLVITFGKPTGATPLIWGTPDDNYMVAELTIDVHDNHGDPNLTAKQVSANDFTAASQDSLTVTLVYNNIQKSIKLSSVDMTQLVKIPDLQVQINKILEREVRPQLLNQLNQ